MALAVKARRNGDTYQARVFWLYLVQLSTNDFVRSVSFECEEVNFVDDVVVEYSPAIIDKVKGSKIENIYIQSKYHIVQHGSFTYQNLIDPKFINNKCSMLQRLYQAYLQLKNKKKGFLLFIYSNWNWHPDNEITKYVHEETIRDNFFTVSPRSKAGKIRRLFQDHLDVDSKGLKSFLRTVRFKLGKGLVDLSYELEVQLKLAGLKPIKPDSYHIQYDDLAWNLFDQGINKFNKESFRNFIVDAKLIDYKGKSQSEISVQSFLQFARRPQEIQSAHLNLTVFFKQRRIINSSWWNTKIISEIKNFFLNDALKNLPQPIRLFFDCHLSISFLIGTVINPKFGIQIIPMQKSRILGYEEWNPVKPLKSDLWKIEKTDGNNDEMIVCISVTNPVENQLLPCLKPLGLNSLPRFSLKPIKGIGLETIANGNNAWELAYELQSILREQLPAHVKQIHIFLSSPVAFAYLIGNTLRGIVPKIQLYEFDFEGNDKIRYSKSICITN